MASPQKERGFTPIANEILESLVTVKMSGAEWQFLLALIRKTYGYGKRGDWITNSQICVMTGLPKERVSEAKKKLLARKMVTENGNKISYQKDWELWNELRKNVTGVTEKRNNLLRKNVNTKESKETITKDTRRRGVDNNKKEKQKIATMEDMSQFNPLGAEVIYEMIKIDPKNKTYYKNTSQRSACDFLIEEYGLEEVKNRILIVLKTNGVPFFPTITTPVQLRDKWVALQKALERHQKESGKGTVAF